MLAKELSSVQHQKLPHLQHRPGAFWGLRMGLHPVVPAHGPSKSWSPGAELGPWTGGSCSGPPGEAGKAIKATAVLREPELC